MSHTSDNEVKVVAWIQIRSGPNPTGKELPFFSLATVIRIRNKEEDRHFHVEAELVKKGQNDVSFREIPWQSSTFSGNAPGMQDIFGNLCHVLLEI